MGDKDTIGRVIDEALWQEFLLKLVRQKQADGKSGAEAYNEALRELDRAIRGPGRGEDAAKELKEKIDELTSRGMSGPRAYYKVASEYLKQLEKSNADRIKEFQAGLRMERQKARDDKSLDTAKDIGIEGFWKKTGQGLLKDFWKDLTSDRSEHKTFLHLLRDTFRMGIEETGKAARDEIFKQLRDQSFPEMAAQTERVAGPTSPHLTLQELFSGDARRRFDQDLFEQLKLGRDGDRALERLGITTQ